MCLIFIDPASVQILGPSYHLAGGAFRPQEPDMIALHITAAAQMGITWLYARWYPARILKLVIPRCNLNDGGADILRHSIGDVKEKCERRAAPALCIGMGLYCGWHVTPAGTIQT